MLAYLRKPHVDLSSFILRFGVGFVFIAHGYIKVFQPLSWTEVISRNMQQVVGWTELVCGVLLMLGLLSRLAALGVIVDMIGAMILVTGPRGFIGVEVGKHGFTFQASGCEYNVVIIVACLAVVLMGGGWFSLDHLLFSRIKKSRVTAAPTGAPHLQTPEPISSAT